MQDKKDGNTQTVHYLHSDSVIDHVSNVYIHDSKVDGDNEEPPEPRICCPLGGGHQVDDEKSESVEDNCL